MKMPGFTAESSLYESHERYRFDVADTARPDTREVVPQGCIFNPSLGMMCCCLSGSCICSSHHTHEM